MVEIKLESLDLPNDADTYIAVRVGDNQKLSRLSAARSFKFAQKSIGDRKFGKVDVFQKVGTASIGIKPEDGMGVQELGIACKTGTKLNFRVSLGMDPVISDKPAAKDLNPAIGEAKNYVLEHNLEMLLSDAMQAVLRERPANPAQFISEKLRLSEGSHRRVQTAPEGATRTRASPGMQAEAEELRMAAKNVLLQASSNGQLDTAIGKVMSSKADGGTLSTESLRQQAKLTLLDATQSGKLDAALTQLKGSKGFDGGPFQLKAKQPLLDAATTGKLNEALANSSTVKARQSLLVAASIGKLEEALAKVKGGQSAGEVREVAALRQEARETLLAASSGGQLDAVMTKVKGSNNNVEAMKQKLAVALYIAGAAFSKK